MKCGVDTGSQQWYSCVKSCVGVVARPGRERDRVKRNEDSGEAVNDLRAGQSSLCHRVSNDRQSSRRCRDARACLDHLTPMWAHFVSVIYSNSRHTGTDTVILRPWICLRSRTSHLAPLDPACSLQTDLPGLCHPNIVYLPSSFSSCVSNAGSSGMLLTINIPISTTCRPFRFGRYAGMAQPSRLRQKLKAFICAKTWCRRGQHGQRHL